MSASTNQGSTTEILSEALANGRFPKSIAPRAQELLDRLHAPARITLLGLPKVGKTGVLNLLAGGNVIPDGIEMGTVRVEYGAKDQTNITLADGKTVTMNCPPDPFAFSDIQAMLTQVLSPLPVLKNISLLEVSLTGDAQAQARAMKWAAKQTDIAIWCTDGFSPQEAALWQTTPDRMRDHGIVLQTRADLLGAERPNAVSRLWQAVGDEFTYALDVSVHEANAAAAGGTVDKAMMRASGGIKLISTILKEIENSRQHMVDQADVLLRMHPEADVKTMAKDAGAKATKASPAPSSEPTKSETAESAQPEAPANAKAPVQDANPASYETVVVAFKAAADRLSEAGRELQGEDAPDSDTVLDVSANVLEWLNQHLEEATLPNLPEVKSTLSMTQDAEDLVQLLRIEASDTGHTDAILALLQLKRGFQAALAA